MATRTPVKRHHGIVRLTHWLNAVFLLGMIASGLQIYLAFAHFGPRGEPYYPNPLDGGPIPHWARLGGWLAGGLNWHFALAWPFVLTGLLYLGFLAWSGEWRSLLFRPRDLGPAVQMQLYYLRLRRDHPPQGKHNALQKGAYTAIVLLGVVSVLSRVRHLQAGAARLAHRAVRGLRARALLALLGGVDLRRLHPAPRRPGAPGGSRVAPGDDHGVVPGEVSQPWLTRAG